MLSILLQVLYVAGFLAIGILVWGLNSRPRWGFRSVMLGWFALLIWALVWSFLLPKLFKGFMNAEAVAASFPDRMIIMPIMFGGWFYPLFVIIIRDALHPPGKHGKA